MTWEPQIIADAVCDNLAYSEVQVFVDRLRFNDILLSEIVPQVEEVKELRAEFTDLADKLEHRNEEIRKEDEEDDDENC